MITIVTIRPCPAETGGGMWGAGETHEVSLAFGKSLIGRGEAYDLSGAIKDVEDPDLVVGYLGNVADEAAMLALAGATLGDEVYRSDTGTFWKLVGAPPSSAANWRELVSTAPPSVQTFYFSAAGTYIIAAGPARAYSVFLTTSVTGTVRIYDNVAASGPDVLGSTVTAAGSNVAIPVGTPPTYGQANTGLCLVVTGTNVGYVVYSAA